MGPNHARRMWPDPAAAVADAVEQRKPRESRRVVLEFYPVDGGDTCDCLQLTPLCGFNRGGATWPGLLQQFVNHISK